MTQTFDPAAITAQSRQAAEELLEAAKLRPGDVFVVGCSSSEIVGGHIGKDSSMEAAAAVLAGILPVMQEHGLYLAAQCCEHLNRAIVVERAAAEKYGYTEVNAIPQPSTPFRSPMRAAAGPPTAGRNSTIPFWWKKSAPVPASTSAAPLSGCTCAVWRCRCGSA